MIQKLNYPSLIKTFLLTIIVNSSFSSIGYAGDLSQNFNFPLVSKNANEPVVLGPAGETFDFIRTGKTTCGKYLLAKLTVPPYVGLNRPGIVGDLKL